MRFVKKSSKTTRSNPWTRSTASSKRRLSTSSAIPRSSNPSHPSPISQSHCDMELVLHRAQVLMEQAPGYYQPEQLAFVLKNLGDVYLRRHRDHDAESLLRRALAIREKEFGPVHELVAYTLNSLANVYFNQSRLADAEALYQRALAIEEKTLGPNHSEVAAVLSNLARI